MAIKPNRDLTFTLALKSGSDVMPIPTGATVTARLYLADGVTPLSGVVAAFAGTLGANWAQGLVVVEIPASETALVVAPQVAIIVTVSTGGSERSWLTYVEVDSGDEDKTALFARGTSVSQFRADRFRQVFALTGANVSDDYIWAKLVSAEAEAQRSLHVFFQPTTLFPDEPTQAEVDALAGGAWAVDPGYDMDQDLLQPGGWSFLTLRQKPVIEVSSIKFAYPTVGTVFTIPPAWIKLDRKYGHVRFIPTGNAFTGQWSGMMAGAMGMQGAPQSIEVRYRAGLRNAAKDYPDLVSVVQRLAMAHMLTDAVLPASSSISADGLSQSKSPPDLEKLMADIDKSLDGLRQRIHGVPMMVL